jgi:hypothetical protein
MLPGRDPHGEAICTSCAGITRDFHCARCRREGHLWAGRICTRCVLHDQLTDLLDDGTGHTRPELLPLLESLHAMPQPDRGVIWLRNNPHLPGYLRGLAQGEIPLSHAALHELPSWRTAAHLRDLLMACGALPHVDRRILLYEQWYLRQLANVTDPDHRRLLRQYATWDQLPRLHAAARTGRLTTGARNHAAGQFTCAARFLTWLAARGRHHPGRHRRLAHHPSPPLRQTPRLPHLGRRHQPHPQTRHPRRPADRRPPHSHDQRPTFTLR